MKTKPFPPEVKGLLFALYQWCVYCGSTAGLHCHHRRIKGMGGDKGPHAQCACNGVVLCCLHHLEAHNDRLWSGAMGYVVSRYVERPGQERLAVYSGDRTLPEWKYPTCEGGWAA